jgi:hypothetical protein
MKTFTKKISSLSLIFLAGFGVAQAQITFTNQNASLHTDAGVAGANTNNRSGNAVCIVDVDNNGLDDVVKLDNNQYLRIEYQQAGGTFTYVYVGDCGVSSLWGMSMSDVDHNGYKDLLFGNGNQAYLFKLNATGTGFLAGSPIALPSGNVFCQNVNFMDANNDGWEDIFSTNDVDECRMWLNNGTGSFPTEQANSLINFNVTPGTGPGPALTGPAPNDQYDESGNYSSVWTDFDDDGDVDLYVTHCRQGASVGDVRRVSRLFKNNAGTWTESAATHGLNSGDQDWTSSFGDMDNDGDFDIYMTKVNVSPVVYTNNGGGNYTAGPSMVFGSQPYQSLFEDFDNDGFVDIMVCGTTQQMLYRNNGNSTFTQVSNATLGFGANTMLSFAAGDLNHDGKVDLYASYGSGYNTPSGTKDDVYWKNTTSNTNHFLTVNLSGTQSTIGGLGARVFIYGSWGVQTREVRASESYGTLSTYSLHFGLGSGTTVDSIRVNWPSGNTDLLVNQTADQFIAISENSTCNISGVTITYTGSTTFCSPDSIQLNAPVVAGYSYLWSSGETTASIYANSTASYSVVCSTSPTCSASSPSVAITVDPTETVSISAGGSTTFCPGGSVTLTSTQASGNTWSTSQTTQSINATAAGSYSVSYQGLCQAWPSNSILVTLLNDSPPATTDDFVVYPAVGTVTGTGTDLYWYDSSSGGILLGTGGSYSPGVISTTTTYYCEDVHSYGGSTGNHVGSTNIAASGFSGTGINGYNKFTVTSNCTLVSVQCSTDVAGSRIIELRNSGGVVLDADTITLPVGMSTVTLNFSLTPGVDYQLGTNTANNTTVLGFASPQLVRDNSAPAFPFTLAGAISITTGNNGSADVSAYYYFYDWIVDVAATDVCTSARTPATINVTAGSGIETNSNLSLNVYPNPTTEFVNVEFTTAEAGEAMLSVYDMLGKKVYDVNLGVVDGKMIKTISTISYAKGVYNVKLTVNGKEYNTRVVVK